MELDTPKPQCIVYLDLKKEVAKLFPSGRIYSGIPPGRSRVLPLSSMQYGQSEHDTLLWAFVDSKQKENSVVTYEFAARTRPSENFACRTKASYDFTGQRSVGFKNFFGMPRTLFMAADSPYFVNGVLHLRAEVSIKQPPQHWGRALLCYAAKFYLFFFLTESFVKLASSFTFLFCSCCCCKYAGKK